MTGCLSWLTLIAAVGAGLFNWFFTLSLFVVFVVWYAVASAIDDWRNP